MPRDDIDLGDACPTEVLRAVPQVWHESMKPATPPVLHCGQTEVGRRALAALRVDGAAHLAPARRDPVAPAASWAALPELYRRMIGRASGLDISVLEKSDRELTEREKALMRSAISDMRAWLGTVAAL